MCEVDGRGGGKMRKRNKLLVTLFVAVLSASCAPPAVGGTVLTPTIRPPRPTATRTVIQKAPTVSTSVKDSFPTDLPGCIDGSTATKGTVVEIIDGDTIVAMIDGEEQKVRYIGIDSPEVGSPGETAEKSKDANSALTIGRMAFFFSDVEDKDMYDRPLRYIFVGDKFINQELVKLGLAEEQEYPSNTACAELLRETEHEAKQANLGIWKLANTDPVGGLPQITAVDKRAEFVIITNNGQAVVDLYGWVLMSERGNQSCALMGILPVGASIKIYAQTGEDGLSCGSKDPIWNNSEIDPAALYNPAGELVDRWEDEG